MENNKENNGFSYTYSAKEQAELKRIREKYIAREESKMERLRRLDSGATGKAIAAALGLGILGVLIMGVGMSLVMTELGSKLGIESMLVGVIIGIVGIILTAIAYPVYMLVLKKQREKIAPEVIRLTDELMKLG